MKKKLTLVIFFMICILMVGCGNDNEVVTPVEPTGEVTSAPIADGELTTVNYYIVDAETMDIVAETAFVPSNEELTPDQVLDFILDSMADYSIFVDYDNVSLEDNGDAIVVDFTSSIKDVSQLGEDFEKSFLDAIAQSMLDNFISCNHVSYLIEGGAYETDNNSFAKGFHYMDR